MKRIAKISVWYDRKRNCYVSNVAFANSKLLGIPADVLAKKLAEWLEETHPELVEKAWMS